VRIALVTPFAWSQPHDVNEHVDGLARELRRRGHAVTVLAPSNRARDLAAGRRALLGSFDDPELIALGPAVPISRRSRMGVPVGVRASLSLALARGRFDVVHGFEPGLPSLSYLALRDAAALTAATFSSADRLGYPPGRAQRERLLGRVDALLATSEDVAEAATVRFPGHYELVPNGIDPQLFAPERKRKLVVLEWRQNERPLLRALVRELAQQPEWELVLLRIRTPASRPAVSRRLRGRMRVRTARTGAARAELLRSASIFVPAAEGLPRLVAEAQTTGAAIAAPPGRDVQPELAAAETARLIEDDAFRERRARESLTAAQAQTVEVLADRVEAIYDRLGARRRSSAGGVSSDRERDWIVADLHLHTSWSHDC
jgi:phosphatidylinositol alpha-mannosyltransferase